MRAQSVDISFTGVGDQRFRDNRLEIYDVGIRIKSRGCGEIVAVPLGDGLGNERPAKESDRQIGTIGSASADDGRRDGSEAGASISLKCVAVIIASGDQKNPQERKDAHCPKPLHENSLLCPRACSGNPLSQTKSTVTAKRSTAEVRCMNGLAR